MTALSTSVTTVPKSAVKQAPKRPTRPQTLRMPHSSTPPTRAVSCRVMTRVRSSESMASGSRVMDRF